MRPLDAAVANEDGPMSPDPAKLDALRKLTEAAERHGWTAGIDTDGDPWTADGAVEFYVCDGFVRMVGTPEDTPVELMTLLLEASR